MKVEFVSPFAEAAINVLNAVLQSEPQRGKLSARPQMFTSQQVNIVCGVTGDIQGQAIYGLSTIAADRLAGAMLGTKIVTFDQLAASAIAELGNMITGNAATLLAGRGFDCDITPPTLVRGSNLKISTIDIPALVIPLSVKDVGELEVNVSLTQRTAK